MIAKSELLKKILTATIIGLIGALTLLLAFSAPPVNGDQLNGRAVIGTVAAVGVDAVTVSTAQLELTLKVDQNTRISAPGNGDASLEDLAGHQVGRVAVLADRELINEDGTAVDQATAVKISIIPPEATRLHRRVVITEKRDETEGTAVDADGKAMDLLHVETSGVGSPEINASRLGLPEAGESAILLVRRGNGGDREDEVTVVIKSQNVVERLIRLAQLLKTENEDAFQSARIERLLDIHRDDATKRLEKILSKAEDRFTKVIDQAAKRAAKALESARESQGTVSGLDQDRSECVQSILGSLPASIAKIPPGQFEWVEVQCLREKDEELDAKLTSPLPGTTLTEGDEITVSFEAVGLGDNLIQLLINGEGQALEAETDESQRLSFLVPVDEPIMTVELRTISAGETGKTIQKVLYDVVRDPPPALCITGVEAGEGVKPESTITLGVLAADNGQIVSINLAVNGVGGRFGGRYTVA